MASVDSGSFPKVLTLYLELSQYPTLAPLMRQTMRDKLFERGVINQEDFESEVIEKARQSQLREGLSDLSGSEPAEIWRDRLRIVRDNLTDFYFAYNLPHELFEEIVRDVLAERVPSQDVVLTFHPELAPWDMLFSQGEAYESLPQAERARVDHHLQEIKVVLIKSMISDHLEYLGIAKDWLDISTLRAIRERRIGRGKIGGKAAGIKLAETVLRKSADEDVLQHLRIPASWYIGADAFYQFTQMNGLLAYANQKYKPRVEIEDEYPTIRQKFKDGRFPDEIVDGLRRILEEAGGSPLIVRSSSLLEDSFGTSFAGKYESYFCPNQGSPKENLGQLIAAITRVYASVYSPDVLLYRRRMGLIDYDERMAILIQQVFGRPQGRYFMPDGAGVAFSRNQFRWSERIERNAGFLRIAWGLGTRAVETESGDYPRLVALSHPELRPESSTAQVLQYSQRQVDLIDLESNRFESLPIDDVVATNTPHLRWVGQIHQDGSLHDIISRPLNLEPGSVVITFHELLRRTAFPTIMRRMLRTLESAYQTPVDTEFALLLGDPSKRQPEFSIGLLQCRPQSRLQMEQVRLPKDLPEEQVLFRSERVVPEGRVQDIHYFVYVPPRAYAALPVGMRRQELAKVIGNLNQALEDEVFALLGPGRWGSVNTELGIPVTYADIFNVRALIELFEGDSSPEPSYGTHFFQDLVEAHIYPLALAVEGDGAAFQRDFFEAGPNALTQILPEASEWSDVLRVVDVDPQSDGRRAVLIMDGEADQAVAFLMQSETARAAILTSEATETRSAD